jgi:hypothetical protein
MLPLILFSHSSQSPYITALSGLLLEFHKSFSDYFRTQDQTDPVSDLVTGSEIAQYMFVVMGKKILSVDRFEVAKEGQIGVALLHALAEEFKSRGGGLRACL